MTNAPILIYPDLYVDASRDGLGMVLGQTQYENEVVIAYSGRELNRVERNYCTTEWEALAVIKGTKKFQTYLYGHHFFVHTDHQSKLFPWMGHHSVHRTISQKWQQAWPRDSPRHTLRKAAIPMKVAFC